MKKKHMRDKSNPLLKQDNKLYKRAFSLIYIIIYIFWTMGFIGIIIDWFNGTIREGNGIGDVITGIIMWTLFTWFIFGKVLNKNARNSMSAMRGSCTDKEMYDLLSNQTFHKIKNAGGQTIEESELWLKINGVFIPKNFVVAGYDIDKMHGSKHLELILLNGREAMYSTGTKEKWFVDSIKYFNKTIPHGNFNNLYQIGRHQSEVRAQLREKFKKYKENGNNIEDLINNYTDFSEGVDYLTFCKKKMDINIK